MKKTQVTLITLLLLIFTVTSSHSSERFSYGIKAGLNFSRFIIDKPIFGNPEYPYLVGLHTGIFFDLKLSQTFSISSEISYLKLRSKISGTDPGGERNNLRLLGDFFTFPLQLKFFLSPSIPYIVTGLDLEYVVNARLEWYDDINLGAKSEENLEKNLPLITRSFILGVGKKLKLYNYAITGELRFLLGLTEYYSEIYRGSWKNSELQILFGISF